MVSLNISFLHFPEIQRAHFQQQTYSIFCMVSYICQRLNTVMHTVKCAVSGGAENVHTKCWRYRRDRRRPQVGIFFQVMMVESVPSIIDPDKKIIYEFLKSSIAEVAQTRAEWEALSRIEVLREMATEEALLAGLVVENYDLAVAFMKKIKEDNTQKGF